MLRRYAGLHLVEPGKQIIPIVETEYPHAISLTNPDGWPRNQVFHRLIGNEYVTVRGIRGNVLYIVVIARQSL